MTSDPDALLIALLDEFGGSLTIEHHAEGFTVNGGTSTYQWMVSDLDWNSGYGTSFNEAIDDLRAERIES